MEVTWSIRGWPTLFRKKRMGGLFISAAGCNRQEFPNKKYPFRGKEGTGVFAIGAPVASG
jgi:hypothetical protein